MDAMVEPWHPCRFRGEYEALIRIFCGLADWEACSGKRKLGGRRKTLLLPQVKITFAPVPRR